MEVEQRARFQARVRARAFCSRFLKWWAAARVDMLMLSKAEKFTIRCHYSTPFQFFVQPFFKIELSNVVLLLWPFLA